MFEYNEEICKEKHATIAERYNRHEDLLKDHETKIDYLCKNDAENTNEIKHLCKQLKGQTSAIWGLVSVVIASLLAFFFTR
jgi:hypothetical protein